MQSYSDIFFALLGEFLLISEGQHTNPVQEIIKQEKDTISGYYLKIKNKFLNYQTNLKLCLPSEDEILFFGLLNDFLSSYFNENPYYFNNQSKSLKLVLEPDISQSPMNDYSVKYFIIKYRGTFFVSKDLKDKKNHMLKQFVVKNLFTTENNKFNSCFLNKSLLNSFIEIINETFDAIGFIEKLILNFYFKETAFTSHYIINSINLKEKILNIHTDFDKQINDWKQIFHYQASEGNSGLPFPPLDTSLIEFKQQINFETLIGKTKPIDFSVIDGLLIHGENLKVLYYLLSNSIVQVDCIYIDPPYNTGSDVFQYKDDFSIDQWYWFMENRLSLAYDLLKEDGTIFVSIDDNQLVSLRSLLDSIFDRFVGMFIWHKKTQPSFLKKELITVTEYIVVYKKGKNPIKLKGGFTDPNKHTELLNISNDVSERILPKDNTFIYNNGNLFTGVIEKGSYGNNKLQVILKNVLHVSEGICNENIILEGKFRWTQKKIDSISDESRKIVIKSLKTLRPTVSGSGKVKIRPPITLLSKKVNNMPTNTDGNVEMKNLFKIPPFYYPKPQHLIKYIIDSVTYNNKQAIILDFFAGSGTTGSAVINLNREDGGKRKFILIEEADYFTNILVSRIKKNLYASDWNKGNPVKISNFESTIQVLNFGSN